MLYPIFEQKKLTFSWSELKQKNFEITNSLKGVILFGISLDHRNMKRQ